MREILRDTQRYVGDFTNTDRWQDFKNNPGDVYVSTPPKCGTTWTTTIVTMLCHGTTDVVSNELVHWVDANVVPLEETLNSLAAQQHRRCIKSHTPFDGMPYFEDATYIAVYRHPLDVLFSHRSHTRNWKDAPPDHPHFGDANANLKSFVTQALDFEDYDGSILEAIIRHYLSFIAAPVPKNVLILHYADMLVDSHGAIQQIADFMEIEPNTGFMDAVQDATSFDNMKSGAERYAPFGNREFWRDATQFFKSGGTGNWTGELSEKSLALYRDRVSALLAPDELAWLEGGSLSAKTSA